MFSHDLAGNIIPYLKYIHGAYNGAVILLFLYQAWLGLNIRKCRKAGKPLEVKLVRRHRKFGPFAAVDGIIGFAGGIGTAYLSFGAIFVYPIHFLTGLTISALIIITFLFSRKIKGREPKWRTIHYLMGLIIISLYLFQAYLGIGILF